MRSLGAAEERKKEDASREGGVLFCGLLLWRYAASERRRGVLAASSPCGARRRASLFAGGGVQRGSSVLGEELVIDAVCLPVLQIDPGDPLGQGADHLVVDGALPARYLSGGDLLLPVPADEGDPLANGHLA